MDRVITYVDGFNLYFGLKTSGLGRCRWLNVQALASNLLLPSQQLVYTKYFTARIIDPEDKRKRQVVYLEALETLNSFNIFYGKYQRVEQSCRACGATRTERNEKMTDVNIAVEMLADAFQNKFDTAILISGDSDLTAPIAAIRRLFPHKRVVVAFPPNRRSFELRQVANAYFSINEGQLVDSLFQPQVVKANGFVLQCPPKWR